MELYTLIIAGVALLIFGVAGYLRDTRRNILTLASTLLGVLIVETWVPRWVAGLVNSIGGGDPGTLTMVLSVATLLLTVGFVGSGGARLLPKAEAEKPTARSVTIRTILGVVNGALVAAYLVQYTSKSDRFAQVRDSVIGAALLDYQRWLLLGPALIVALLVIIGFFMRLVAPKQVQAKPAAGAAGAAGAANPAPKPQSAAPANKSPDGRIDTAGVASKIDQKLGGR